MSVLGTFIAILKCKVQERLSSFFCLFVFVFFNEKVLACHAEEMWCAESQPVTVETFDTPEKPYALAPENTSLQLGWKAPSNANLISFWFELQKVHLTIHLFFFKWMHPRQMEDPRLGFESELQLRPQAQAQQHQI